MRVSVVINTYNRAASLEVTLKSLRYQTYSDFEVIVVNGPSTDGTEQLLARHPDVRARRCPVANISKSRNIGIAAAAGDVVAFIDDDAIPDPYWLADIVAGYSDEHVGGVGGIVYNHTGYELQYARCVTHRRSPPRFDVEPPYFAYQIPHGDWYLHLLGTNATFRRRLLEEIGGFDEEFEYFLDETDVCMRIIDKGYWLKLLPGAAVYHKYLPSHMRCEKYVKRQPYPIVKNAFYFALQTLRRDESFLEALDFCHKWADDYRRYGEEMLAKKIFSEEENATFQQAIDRATRDGLDRGMHGVRKTISVPPALPDSFLAYETHEPAERLTICMVSRSIPPDAPGGIGRFTLDQARGFAALGHEVHLLTASDGINRVDFEEGVWVHRLKADTDGPWASPRLGPLTRSLLGRAAAVHREIRRLAETRVIDLVSVPIWDFEGYFCLLDDELTTVLTLQTTLKLMAEVDPRWTNGPEIVERLAFEKATVRSATHIHAISEKILEKVEKDYGPLDQQVKKAIVPLGIPDRGKEYSPREPDGKIQVLFVGRLERRKGVDVLLEAAARIAAEFTNVEFLVVGDDKIPSPDGSTYRAGFERRHGDSPDAKRIKFLGEVPEDALYRHYATCDVFVAPSRYESFGLVFLEAMMFGKPVIGCSAGGMPEVIEDGASGFLALPGDVNSLVERLRWLVQDSSLRARLGRRGRELFEEKFSAERMIHDTLSAYTEMLGRPWSVDGVAVAPVRLAHVKEDRHDTVEPLGRSEPSLERR